MDTKQLTQSQKELINLFVSTKTNAKVRRRTSNADGTYSFNVIYRDTSPFDFALTPEEFALKIHEQKPDAPLSPIYINLRSLPENLNTKIGEVLAQIQLPEKADFCTSIPKAADAFIKSYSSTTGVPIVQIFDKVDGDQKRAVVAKQNAPKGNGKKIVLIDDLIVHGNSKVEALKIADDLGYKVIGLVVLIDRQQGGVVKIEEMGYKTFFAMNFTSILEYLKDSKQISQGQYREVIDYLKK